MKIKQAASAFLSHQRIAVTGVSRSPKTHGANVVYRRLRASGYDVGQRVTRRRELWPCTRDLRYRRRLPAHVWSDIRPRPQGHASRAHSNWQRASRGAVRRAGFRGSARREGSLVEVGFRPTG